MAAGVDWVGVAELTVGLGLLEVGAALVVLALALELVAAGDDGNKIPACERTTPTKANNTRRISAINGQVHGLRPLR
mgnify:CR=1 FL=1